MTPSPSFDRVAAHKYFSAQCFNQAWELIEKPDRTPEDDLRMVSLNQASLYHWQQRPDCTDQNLSIAYWQSSRIQSLLGNAAEARRYAEVCLGLSLELDAFHLGYAHEALARASYVAGDRAEAREHLERARRQAQRLTRAEDRGLLEKDLDGLDDVLA